MRVPAFLVRRFYVAGSLRNTDRGFQLQAQNEMGEGMIVGMPRIAVDGALIEPARITAARDGASDAVRADRITRTSPVPVRRGDRVTIHVDGPPLAAGRHELEVELVERDLGALQLAITETLAEPRAERPPAEPPTAGALDG
ncbi:MAG: hypothetical protein H0V04_04390 [Chloroflexi bacterium]|nr:hypothetical protein [Chloroflexota bacterium]